MKNQVRHSAIFLYSLLILLSVYGSLAFGHHPDSTRKIKVKLEAESYVVIQGKTNVNAFQCRYEELFPGKIIDMNILFTDECMVFDSTTMNLETRKFDSGNRLMNNDFNELLKADDHPFIKVDILCINTPNTQFRSVPVKNANMTTVVYARINIAGQENDYHIPVEILEDRQRRIYKGHLPLNIRDFNIEPPRKMMGMITVDENIFVRFFLVVSLVQ